MASTVARKYDLTKKMAPFFDIHMLLNILNFLREQKLYDVKEITKEKINAIKSTNMLSLIEEEYEKFLGDTDIKHVNEKRTTSRQSLVLAVSVSRKEQRHRAH